jgi:ribosomal protein S18 acetylase RimI-like enzyme
VSLEIEIVPKDEARALVPRLAEILIDAVENGASVSFLRPVSQQTAENYWHGVIEEIEQGPTLLLVARLDRHVVGTVLVVSAWSQNGPHRADIAKMLVHSSARRRGIGLKLLQSAEEAAFKQGKRLLVLDTELGSSGEGLYTKAGWTRLGTIPNYHIASDGQLGSTVYFYKQLEPSLPQ